MATGITIRNGSDDVRYSLLDIIDNKIEVDGKLYGLALYEGEYLCYPADEKPILPVDIKNKGNVISISRDAAMYQNWGVIMIEGNKNNIYPSVIYTNRPSIYKEKQTVITRNGEIFYHVKGNGSTCLCEANSIIENKLKQNIPINWNQYDYKERNVGRKILYMKYPAVITEFYTDTMIKFVYTGDKKYEELVMDVWDLKKDNDGNIIGYYDLIEYSSEGIIKLGVPENIKILDNGMIDDRWWKFNDDKQEGDGQSEAD